MHVQFSGVYKIQPVLADHRRSMVDADAVQSLVQGVIDQTYLGTRPRATSFVVDDEVVMVADDRNGQDYTRFVARQAKQLAPLSEPLKRWFSPPDGVGPVSTDDVVMDRDTAGTADAQAKEALGFMPVHRFPFMLPSPGERVQVVRDALQKIHREFLAEATPVALFVRVANRRAAEVAMEHPTDAGVDGETWDFKSKAPRRGFLSIFG